MLGIPDLVHSGNVVTLKPNPSDEVARTSYRRNLLLKASSQSELRIDRFTTSLIRYTEIGFPLFLGFPQIFLKIVLVERFYSP